MIQTIAHSYWRLIKAYRKSFTDTPLLIQHDVKILAQKELEEGLISQEEYLKFIGKNI